MTVVAFGAYTQTPVLTVQDVPGPPTPPTGLAATGISASQIEVDWDTEAGDTRYDVRWRKVVT